MGTYSVPASAKHGSSPKCVDKNSGFSTHRALPRLASTERSAETALYIPRAAQGSTVFPKPWLVRGLWRLNTQILKMKPKKKSKSKRLNQGVDASQGLPQEGLCKHGLAQQGLHRADLPSRQGLGLSIQYVPDRRLVTGCITEEQVDNELRKSGFTEESIRLSKLPEYGRVLSGFACKPKSISDLCADRRTRLAIQQERLAEQARYSLNSLAAFGAPHNYRAYNTDSSKPSDPALKIPSRKKASILNKDLTSPKLDAVIAITLFILTAACVIWL